MGKMLPVLLLTLAVILLPAAAHAATKLTVNPDPAQGGKDAGNQRLRLAGEAVEQLLKLQRGDGPEHPITEDRE